MYQRLLIPATDQLPCFRTVVTYASDSQLDAFLVDDLDDIVFFEIACDPSHADQQDAGSLWTQQRLFGSLVDMYLSFGKTFGVGDPLFHAADRFV